MEDSTVEKTEFNYLATALIFGKKSPIIRSFNAFSFDTLRKEKNIVFSEMEGLNPQSQMDVVRRLKMDDKREFETSHADVRSGISRILKYSDKEYNIRISDTIFNDEEF